jgi:hypothetical protein
MILGFGIVGGTVFCLTAAVHLKTSWQRTMWVGLTNVAIEGALIWTAFAGAGSFYALIALSMATACFQATWFTAAFVAGYRIGGVNGAVVATTLEGGLGFTLFVTIRLLSG